MVIGFGVVGLNLLNDLEVLKKLKDKKHATNTYSRSFMAVGVEENSIESRRHNTKQQT